MWARSAEITSPDLHFLGIPALFCAGGQRGEEQQGPSWPPTPSVPPKGLSSQPQAKAGQDAED